MLTNVSSSVFTDSDSITLLPVVSAEWNQNLFNQPYITVAGTGSKITVEPISPLPSDVTVGAKPNFTTKSFTMSGGKGSTSYTCSAGSSSAYKVITYIKTNQPVPVMVTLSGKGTGSQYGSEQAEADSLGWTRVVTYIGSTGPSETFSSFVYTITANTLSNADTNATVYFTVPEVYPTTYFDYQNHSLFPTEMPFTYFRPGESYVSTGDAKYSFPSNYRRIASKLLSSESASEGFFGKKYMPVSPIIQNPKFFLASPAVPTIKSALPTDIAPYRYFVSDPITSDPSYKPSITAIYEKAITTNKIVLKFNTLMTVPTVNVSINGNIITVDGSQSITFPDNGDDKYTGVITLYWNGTAWTKKKWKDADVLPLVPMPQLTSSGALSLSTTITKITVTQVSKTTNSEFSSYSSADVLSDLNRMHLIEVSPRLEIDLTDFVQDLSINKSLDSSNTALPISSLNTNDAQITLSGIPAMNGSTLVPIFSSQSDQSSTILANMMRKNVKFYVNFNLASYSTTSGTTSPNTYIPGGVFYSDSWTENDIQDVSIQLFDVARYLQSTSVPDYVANLKTVFEIITNILDLAGFTDYDYDSLYSICNSKSAPLDISYFYCNSQDSTIVDTLNQIFVAYQIGAYIDEYGVMKFLSLQNILSSTSSALSISDANINKDGFSISNVAKPGKISLRYQTPKVKQTPSLQNVQDAEIRNSPSFIYTTSNDIVWAQQTMDSVGFNYLQADMEADSNTFNLNNNDLLDIFHTYNLNNDGYAFIENEIVSFSYKEFIVETLDETSSVIVSVKNNIELAAEINRFIKQYNIGLVTSYAAVTNAVGNGTTVTYTANNNFRVGQRVSITGIDPKPYNTIGVITSRSATSFAIKSTATGTFVSAGEAVIAADYDIKVTPTGNITNVQRGLFGTAPSEHSRITNMSQKGLVSCIYNISTSIISETSEHTEIVNSGLQDLSLPDVDKIKVQREENNRVLVFSESEDDIGYHTYSVKFELMDQDCSAAGLFFNMQDSSTIGSAYFVELLKLNTTDPKTGESSVPPKYKYIMMIFNDDNSEVFWTDVTGECNSIISNFPKINKKTEVDGKNVYSYISDNVFNLKVVHNLSDGEDGEEGSVANPKNTLYIYLNNVEITGWNKIKDDDYDPDTNPEGGGWVPMPVNEKTGMRQRPFVSNNIEVGTKFGFSATTTPVQILATYPEIEYWGDIVADPAFLREIHATKKPLIERSVSYFYQDREFLNGMVQNQPLYNNSPTYIMQTTPEVSGINYYDVQYTTPAAVIVDINPVFYKMGYYPGETLEDKSQEQTQIVDEYSLSYSTITNTGFRARMAIANGRPHLVFLKKDSDAINDLTVVLNLWTHELVAPSDPEIIEQVIDPSNMSEVVQLDSAWIQSKQAANKLLKVVQMGIEGFSKSAELEIFGNPLIQVGDVITLSYSLNGISQQKYLVHSVSNNFDQGLNTSLGLKRIQE